MRFFCLHVFALLCLSLPAQRIRNFNLVSNGPYVGVRFTVAAGAPGDSYRVYRSSDSLSNFQPIYDSNSPCGNYSADTDESYTDGGAVLNQVNYYKVELVPFEFSGVARIYVTQSPTSSMYSYPNPMGPGDVQLNLAFNNLTNDEYLSGYIYNQAGKPLRSIYLATSSAKAAISVGDLDNGLYVLWLNDGQQAFKTKFIIMR